MNIISTEEVNNRDIDILIVEDNPNDMELTLRGLKKINYPFSVFCVTDGEEAANFILKRENFSGRDGSVKLVLLDLKLPKLNGLEVLREVRKKAGNARLPIIILSSSREENDVKTSYQLGVNSYLVKPVDYDAYMETIAITGSYWLNFNQVY